MKKLRFLVVLRLFNEMIKSIPTYERKSNIFIEKFEAEAKQFGLLDEQIKDIQKQFIVDTATWGLVFYEKELDLVVSPNSTLESRRAAIKAKWRSGGKVDRALLEAVASSILQTVVKVEFDGKIVFRFNANDNKNPNLNYPLFDYMINEIKPAHLGALIKISNQIEFHQFYGGVISVRKRITINPIKFTMPNLNLDVTTAGIISIRNKTTIKPEVIH